MISGYRPAYKTNNNPIPSYKVHQRKKVNTEMEEQGIYKITCPSPSKKNSEYIDYTKHL